MPNNHNCGMHFIHFAKDRTAIHEFDYDNEYISNLKSRKEKERLKEQLKEQQSKKDKKNEPKGKRTSFDVLFDLDRNRLRNTKLRSQKQKLNSEKLKKKKEEAKKSKLERKKRQRQKVELNSRYYRGINWEDTYENVEKKLRKIAGSGNKILCLEKDCIEVQLDKTDSSFIPRGRYKNATERFCFENGKLIAINIYLGYKNIVQEREFMSQYKPFAEAKWGKGQLTNEGHLVYTCQEGEIEISESGIVITPIQMHKVT